MLNCSGGWSRLFIEIKIIIMAVDLLNTKKVKPKHKFPYEWKLSDGYPAKGIEYHGSKIFDCFACGGGSTMGAKLAGYDTLGMNEIDPKMAACYIENHNPKYAFVEPIQEFKNREDLPKELFNLDILSGSPPCSSFSTVGNREKDWGKKKKFREGQAEQVLDTLFFDFLDLAERLQPKVIIAENVKGIIQGKAKDYSRRILERFETAGYEVKHFLLNSKKMGVPQSRPRVFFIGIRKDLALKLPKNPNVLFSNFPLLDLNFNEREVVFGKIKTQQAGRKITENELSIWKDRVSKDRQFSCTLVRTGRKYGYFSNVYLREGKICPTLTAKSYHQLTRYDCPNYISTKEQQRAGTFPQDYSFLKNKPGILSECQYRQ